MKKRTLGNSDLEITAIGLGAWAIGGGGWEFGWGPQEDKDSIAAIHEGLDRGINWIDTAAVYGLGHSEEVVARALQGRSKRPYVFTKCAMVWNESGEIGRSLKAASIRHECEQSLRRLKVDTIDLYQIHWPVPDADIEEAWTELARLVEEGKVRYIGVSNFDAQQMQRAMRIAPITSLQPPYSLLARQIEGEILPFAARHDTLDDWRRRNRNFQEPLLSHNLHLVELLRDIGRRHGVTAGEVAIAWTLNNPAVTGAIVGVRSQEQVLGIIEAGDFRLSAREVDEIAQAQIAEAQELSLFS